MNKLMVLIALGIAAAQMASAQTAPTPAPSGGRGTPLVSRPAVGPAPAPRVMRTPQQTLQMQINNGTLPSGFVIPQGFSGSLPPGYRIP